MSSPSLRDVLFALESRGPVKREGVGFRAPCPAHGGTRFNLAVREGRNGSALVTCHSRGCSYMDVMDALGLSEPDRGQGALVTPGANSAVFQEPVATEPNGGLSGSESPDAVYTYTDKHGRSLFEVVRFPGKQFRQRKPNGEWNMDGVTRTLYRLPEVLQAIKDGRWIHVVEGEKDADALFAVGAVGTCNPGGAGKWQDSYTDLLKGSYVLIVADKDDVGRRHAEDIERRLAPVVKKLRMVEARSGKDAADHLAAGYTVQEWASYNPSTGLVLTRAKDVKPESVRWLDGFKNMLAYGCITGLWGMPGVNKSTWACLVGTSVTKKGERVLFVSGEEGNAPLRGRFEAHGANLELVSFGHMRREGMDGSLVLLPQDVAHLERSVERGNIKFLVIDPIQAHFSPEINVNVDHTVRLALSPLAKMGERTGCAILIISHLTKDRYSTDPMMRAGGSIGIPGISRVCLLMGVHPDATWVRTIVGFKNNYGPKAEPVSYTITNKPVPGYDDPPIWLSIHGARNVTAEALLRRKPGDNHDE